MEFAYSNDERRQEQKRLNTIACHCSLPALLLRFNEKKENPGQELTSDTSAILNLGWNFVLRARPTGSTGVRILCYSRRSGKKYMN